MADLRSAAKILKSSACLLPVHSARWFFANKICDAIAMAFTPRFNPKNAKPRKRPKPKLKTKKKDPIWVDGVRPRPMFVDYKDIELLKKLINRHGRIVSRRKSGCMAVSQHAVALAIKRARFMALLPYVGE
jgi:small subunit ribosomal protein S18